MLTWLIPRRSVVRVHPPPPEFMKNWEPRFWDKVTKTDGCWLWTGAKSSTAGYGRFKIDGVLYSPHRLSFELVVGEIPDGKWVLHKCDNRVCVNPKHLFLGDRSDNMIDAYEKNRVVITNRPKGERVAGSVLKEEDIPKILEQRRSGMSYREIANHFGCSLRNIGMICQGKTWRHVSQSGQAAKATPS